MNISFLAKLDTINLFLFFFFFTVYSNYYLLGSNSRQLKWHSVASLILSSGFHNVSLWRNFVHTPFRLSKIIVCFHFWPVPLCYQSTHSNLKEKRQILKDTVNHIQTIHRERGTEERKIERAYLQKDLNFYIWKNTYYAI